jgi:hypothetical protein
LFEDMVATTAMAQPFYYLPSCDSATRDRSTPWVVVDNSICRGEGRIVCADADYD